ncbi:DUF3558 domain-containing protein [Nocardia rhamnosiphila]|uniref:DUF3558 domain-containing protein n=1 Tax=Nocardia rhamnosiphila TaxID=426716 RepID=UPI00068E4F8C|nr:DUF3558 domain-containing protein [Nocardia rhamnosiphila]
MVAAGKRKALIALVGGAVLVLTGCESATKGSTAPDTPSVAAEVPTGFDPCTDIPQETLKSEGLRDPMPDDASANGIKWDGCMWIQTDGYSAAIRTTNMTLDMIKDQGFPGTLEFETVGRSAIVSQQGKAQVEASCNVNVELIGGSLEFLLTNPPSRSKTGHLDTCELARNLVEKVAPNIPAGA